MIDLHLHTTASDGSLPPAVLVARAARAGLTTISITDHDTVGGIAEGRAAARRAGLRLVPGIEITAVENGLDVHVLGYFFDEGSAELARFLETQREDRVRRIRTMEARLRELGCAVDLEPLVTRAAAEPGRSVGRPLVADALVAAGHAVDRKDAFERWLGAGKPAFVPRTGARVADVIRIIAAAGGISSLAHPGPLQMDEAIPAFIAAGLDAIEVRHSEHDEAAEARYRQLATQHRLAVSGGSDFHADDDHHAATLGGIALPPADFALLEERARSRHAADRIQADPSA